MKTDSLSARYDTVSQSHSERFSALEQAQVLVTRFWETFEELEPWLGETETLITQLPPPAIDTDALRLQQDQMRVRKDIFFSAFQLKCVYFYAFLISSLCPATASPAAQGVYRRAQAPHRQAAKDRTPAGRAQPPGGGDDNTALHRGRETLPGHQRGRQGSCNNP